MKRKPILIVVLLLFVLAIWYFVNVYGWLKFYKNTDTPKQFLNQISIKKEDYSRDSIKVLENLQYLLKNHEQSFYVKDYFDSTHLFIDTILYSPDFNKLAIFVLTKNPTYGQLVPDNRFYWYYDGYCYLGIRESDTINLTWISGGFSNSYSKEDLVKSLRKFYFRMFASIKDTSGISKYKYNLNDIRFWNCPIWKELEEEKIRRMKFEEFLRKNLPAELHRHYITNLFVVVQFIAKQDSTLSNFTYVSGNKKLFEDAAKAVKLSEPWIPGIYKSKSVQTLGKLKVIFPQPG